MGGCFYWGLRLDPKGLCNRPCAALEHVLLSEGGLDFSARVRVRMRLEPKPSPGPGFSSVLSNALDNKGCPRRSISRGARAPFILQTASMTNFTPSGGLEYFDGPGRPFPCGAGRVSGGAKDKGKPNYFSPLPRSLPSATPPLMPQGSPPHGRALSSTTLPPCARSVSGFTAESETAMQGADQPPAISSTILHPSYGAGIGRRGRGARPPPGCPSASGSGAPSPRAGAPARR